MADTLTVTIETLGARGDGIGSHDGKPVYVSGVLPGETVAIQVRETRKNGIYGDLLSIERASGERAEPACRHFGRCGGCQLQHLSGNLYRTWVRDRASFALRQQGFDDVPVEEPFITPPASRRRAALKALKTASGLVLGFNAESSHQIVDISECPVLRPALFDLIEPLRLLLSRLMEPRMLAELHMTETASGVDLVIDAPLKLDLAAREALAAFADAMDLASLHWRSAGFLDPVAVRREPVMAFGDVTVPLPAAAFVQASGDAEAAMVARVAEACAGAKRVADLFCGLGTFTFPLAATHQVLAVEGARDALMALEAGRNRAAGLRQIVTKHRDLFRRPLTAAEFKGFDAVVIDPPRAGAQAQMAELAKSDAALIVSVSCNPNTFARDARLLADGGYSLESLLPIDQFLWSPHLELVGIFRRP